MASTYMTPGVYIEEKNAFPNSAVAVETAVPVFIGYTETAAYNGSSLVGKPTRITSFAEYIQSFGPDPSGAYTPKYTISKTAPVAPAPAPTDNNTIIIGGTPWYLEPQNPLYLYNSIRMFYANGGAVCFILSVGTYGAAGLAIAGDDFLGSATKPNPFDILTKETEPTLVVIPDVVALGSTIYNSIYANALGHCADMQSRFAILDLVQQSPLEKTDDVVAEFRNDIGINNLNYGAAYYPWLKTSIVQPDEVTWANIVYTGPVTDILAEDQVKKISDQFATDLKAAQDKVQPAQAALTAAQAGTDPVALATAKKAQADATAAPDKITQNYYAALKANSPTYVALLNKVQTMMNELPPSAAMAGLYTMVDNARGVWKAPANVSVNMVNAPAVNVSSEMQQNLNVDVMAGKSINVIRSFPGVGTLVWGARTLDGNSQDWRYINVRRTLIMLEQSLKLAARAYVFEPNDANTWITVKSMMDNFLTNLWKQGALAGATPDQAFSVTVGLGSTMTGDDILDGKMLITVKVAIVRPAEFIVITFQQQMQTS